MRLIPNKTLVSRFWSHVTKTESCRIYGKQPFNFPKAKYKSVRINSERTIRAHVVSWFIHYGNWPTKNVLHKCDNPPCVNPDHLFEGDQSQNMQDCKLKGRTRGGRPVGKYKGAFKRFTNQQALDILNRLSNGEMIKDIRKDLNCSRTVISHIANGKYH